MRDEQIRESGTAARGTPCRFGRHLWFVAEKTEQPSPIEVFKSAGTTSLKGYAGPPAATKPVIVTYCCERCGGEKVVRV